MSDFLVLGGDSLIYQPDALTDFDGTPDAGTECRFRTKLFVPPDPANGLPASESIFRRVYFTVVHTEGCSFFATPILDSVVRTELKGYFNRPAPSSEERWTFLLPLGKAPARYPNIKTGLRGTGLAILVELTDPEGVVHFESVSIGYKPLGGLLGRKAGE